MALEKLAEKAMRRAERKQRQPVTEVCIEIPTPLYERLEYIAEQRDISINDLFAIIITRILEEI